MWVEEREREREREEKEEVKDDANTACAAFCARNSDGKEKEEGAAGRWSSQNFHLPPSICQYTLAGCSHWRDRSSGSVASQIHTSSRKGGREIDWV